MGDWGIEVGDVLEFEYAKSADVDYTPRRGVVEKAMGWGVVLQEQDPADHTALRYRSYSIYNAEKCRNLIRVPADTPMAGDGI